MQKQTTDMKNSLAEKLYRSIFETASHFSLSDDSRSLKAQACRDKINHYLEWIQRMQANSVLVVSSPSIEALCLCYALVLSNKTYIPIHRSTSSELVRNYLENYQIDWLLVQPQLISQFDSDLKTGLQEDKNSGFFFYEAKRQQSRFCLLPGIIFFTSGSYDQPKAVYYRYETLSPYLSWCLAEFQLRHDDCFLFTTELSFVASLRPLFIPALAGAKLHFPGNSSPNKLQLIIDSLIKEKISILNLTPSLFKILLQHIEKNSLLSILTSIRLILLSGEPLNIEDINYWFAHINKDSVFYNLYGATEYLVPFYKQITANLEENERLDLGQLRKGCNYKLVADPIKGYELYVSGDIATAYLDSQLTQKNYLFIDNCRFIKTHDFVTKQANQLFFSSRGQRAIKKYGQLINLDQLEYVLKTHHSDLNFIIYEEENRIYLVIQGIAYNDSMLQQIKHSLKANLPLYMHPDEYLFREEIPLTASGKIDYFSIKKTLAENQLTEFRDYFKRFFAGGEIDLETKVMDLGLESIDYIAMTEALLKITGKWLDISKINENTRIANIDSCLIEPHLEKPNLLQRVTLNPIQGAVYFRELYDEPKYWLCIVASFAIRGNIDLKKMEKAIAETLDAHFILSSKLELIENNFFFVSAIKQLEFRLGTPIFFHRRAFSKLRTSVHADRLVRIYLQKKKNQYFLVMAYHHIAIDGWSALLVREEIFRRYEGRYQNKEIDRATEISHLNQVNQAWLSRSYNFDEFKARLSSIIPYEYNQLDSFFGKPLSRKHLTLILKKDEIKHFTAAKKINNFPYSVIFAYLLHQIIAKRSGTNKLFFYTSFSNRHLPVPHVKELITNLATGLPLFLDDTDITAKEFALQIQESLTVYFQNMSYGALQELWEKEVITREILSPQNKPYAIVYTYINKILEDEYVQNKYIDWDNSINTIQAYSRGYLYLRVFNMGSHFVVFFDGNINTNSFELMRDDWLGIRKIS